MPEPDARRAAKRRINAWTLLGVSSYAAVIALIYSFDSEVQGFVATGILLGYAVRIVDQLSIRGIRAACDGARKNNRR